jgi:hypothetical protein
MPEPKTPVPGDGFLHPMPLVALVTLVVNDHWAKAAWPGLVTGKLSDVAGMVFFPLFLQGLAEVGLSAAGRPWGPSRRLLAGCIAATIVVFGLVKLGPLEGLYEWGLGALQWPFRAAGALIGGRGLPRLVRVDVVADWTDCVALPFALVPLLLRRQ